MIRAKLRPETGEDDSRSLVNRGKARIEKAPYKLARTFLIKARDAIPRAFNAIAKAARGDEKAAVFRSSLRRRPESRGWVVRFPPSPGGSPIGVGDDGSGRHPSAVAPAQAGRNLKRRLQFSLTVGM